MRLAPHFQIAHHGRPCLRLALDAASRAGKPGVDYIDQPNFMLLPEVMTDGAVEVCARLLPDAPDYARGFIGLAYRVTKIFRTTNRCICARPKGRAILCLPRPSV